MHARNALDEVLLRSRLIVCCGSGGVGKTTTSAALALMAALAGRKALVLTIDPAQRLLQALGLHGSELAANTPLEVLPKMAPDLLDALLLPDGRLASGGTLHAMMLDAESGAIAMVERLLPDPTLRDQVLGNRVYRAFLPTLAASPDYIALELIHSLLRDERFDLLILDTPPMHNAMDFLQAGGTLSSFLNERVLKWFARVPLPNQKSRFSFLNTGSSMAMTVLGKLFGSETLPDIAQFFSSFQEVLPRLRDRANETDRLLRSPNTSFLVVTAPGETSLREARHLYGVLREQAMPFRGFIVNRVLQVPDALVGQALDASTQALTARLLRAGGTPKSAQDLAMRMATAARRLGDLERADADHIDALRVLAGRAGFCSVAPQREQDLHSLTELVGLGRVLLDGVEPAMVP